MKTPLAALGLFSLALAFATRPARADEPVAPRSTVYFPARWQLTQYWIARETAGPRDRRAVPVQHRDGHTLALSCPRFVTDLSMEGTGETWDHRLLNWDARVRGRACFVEVDRDAYPYGVGVQGYALVPFRSLAVDRRYLPIGHTVEMAELAGMPLPGGGVHDGCFVSVDGGGAIVGHHIDLFVPSADAWRDLGRAGYLPAHVRSVVLDAPRCAHALRYAVQPSAGAVSPLP